MLKESGEREQRLIPLHQGEPIRFGPDGELGVIRSGFGSLAVEKVEVAGEDAVITHDATLDDPTYAFALSRLSTQDLQHTVTGIFRNITRPTYDDAARAQLTTALSKGAPNLQTLLTGTDTWTVT